MASQAATTPLTAALDRAEASLEALVAVGASPVDGRDAIQVIDRVERLGRKVAAAQVGLLSDIDRRGLHRHDGHHSAKVLVRHVARLSDLEAGRRAQAARALRDLPQVAAALAAGRLGMDQVGVVARAHANTRVRERLCRQDAALARLGAQHIFARFQAAVLDWTRLADADGTADTATRAVLQVDPSLLAQAQSVSDEDEQRGRALGCANRSLEHADSITGGEVSRGTTCRRILDQIKAAPGHNPRRIEQQLRPLWEQLEAEHATLLDPERAARADVRDVPIGKLDTAGAPAYRVLLAHTYAIEAVLGLRNPAAAAALENAVYYMYGLKHYLPVERQEAV